ncbi:uncharacterized protein FIESC28_05431 [Fusarium coffeatum]|uniref:F-box domain-containing protein n=1 Tax=Fusarium coffeatum TaxID=231269 RepID=A0A366RTM1_9HYPO|nr:uncharacterized protein FIESC28_05431 [Fusarium coffeatum]RBR20152.1 hypothetical protein FIESC28_05431 [Fusarium coffeatum]
MDFAVTKYDWGESHDILIPFHEDCYSILEQVVAPTKIVIAALYEILIPHVPDRNAFGLDYDYGGDASACREIEWKWITGLEYVVASPTKIPRVQKFIKLILQESKLEESDVKRCSYQTNSRSDSRFELLPDEIMSGVLECLDYGSLCAIRLASRSAANVTSSNAF